MYKRLENPLPNSGSPSRLIASSPGSSLSFRGSERMFFLLHSLAECFTLTTNLETGRESCFFQAPRSPDAALLHACGHEKFSSGSSTSRLWFNVCWPVGSPGWAGRRTLKYVSSEQETDCLLDMLGVGNVLSTTNLLVFSFEKLCGDRKQHEPQYLFHGEHENKG